jgi:hemerythrin-like domain-containing protein
MKHLVQNLMKEEHKKIEDLLKELESNLENIKNAKDIFNKFKWTLEKHFFIEEKVIFQIYNSSFEKDIEDINKLIKEHKDILWEINQIEDNFNKSIKPEIKNLKADLMAHASFEDQSFYPRLDEELSDENKRLILERCDETIRC